MGLFVLGVAIKFLSPNDPVKEYLSPGGPWTFEEYAKAQQDLARTNLRRRYMETALQGLLQQNVPTTGKEIARRAWEIADELMSQERTSER